MARPRSERAHEAVLAAALKLIADKGIDVTSVDAIAELSGVSKATIYKYWRTKESLCLEAISQVSGGLPAFDSGDPRSGLIELVRYIGRARQLKKGGLGKIWPRIMAARHGQSYICAGIARAVRCATPGAVDLDSGTSRRAGQTSLRHRCRLRHGFIVRTGDASALCENAYAFRYAGKSGRRLLDGERRACSGLASQASVSEVGPPHFQSSWALDSPAFFSMWLCLSGTFFKKTFSTMPMVITIALDKNTN